MENIENQDSSNTEIENNDSEIVEEEATEKEASEEEDETPEEKLAKLEESNKKLFARTKKAEEEVKALKLTPKVVEKLQPIQKAPAEDLDKILDEKLNERDLASMSLSDELKVEVKAYATAKGISYSEASNSNYINFVKEEEEKKNRIEDASVSSKNKSGGAKRDFSKLSEEEIEGLSDEEFVAYKEYLKTQ